MYHRQLRLVKGYPPAKDFLFREKILTSRFAKTLCEISINVKMSSFFQHSNPPTSLFFQQPYSSKIQIQNLLN